MCFYSHELYYDRVLVVSGQPFFVWWFVVLFLLCVCVCGLFLFEHRRVRLWLRRRPKRSPKWPTAIAIKYGYTW